MTFVLCLPFVGGGSLTLGGTRSSGEIFLVTLKYIIL